jgi:hypothetical protein
VENTVFPAIHGTWGLQLVQEIKPASTGDAKRRLAAILRGAFSGPPTPLKDIPKRDGRPRAVKRTKAPKAKKIYK